MLAQIEEQLMLGSHECIYAKFLLQRIEVIGFCDKNFYVVLHVCICTYIYLKEGIPDTCFHKVLSWSGFAAFCFAQRRRNAVG